MYFFHLTLDIDKLVCLVCLYAHKSKNKFIGDKMIYVQPKN